MGAVWAVTGVSIVMGEEHSLLGLAVTAVGVGAVLMVVLMKEKA